MLDHRLPIRKPLQDGPHDICVKETILELCIDRYRARRRDDLDPGSPSYPYTIGSRITAEQRASARISELTRHLTDLHRKGSMR